MAKKDTGKNEAERERKEPDAERERRKRQERVAKVEQALNKGPESCV